MRRFILIFMMVLLPLQWSWAAAASVCAHEQGTSHFGHHEHQHASGEAVHADDGQALVDHPDCQGCHGVGTACMGTAAPPGVAWSSAGPPASDGRHIPEPPVESLLRPPLTLVASRG